MFIAFALAAFCGLILGAVAGYAYINAVFIGPVTDDWDAPVIHSVCNIDGNWWKGKVDDEYTFFAKVYDFASESGIYGGRVSKLEIRDSAGKTVCNYDRGWDIKPTGRARTVMIAIATLPC